MAGFIAERDVGENTSFANPGGSFYINQYFFIEQQCKSVLENTFHIHHDSGGEYKLRSALDMHECIQLELAQVVIVYIDITINLPEINTKSVWIVIDQVHGQGRLVESQCFQFYIFDIAVIKSFWFLAGNEDERKE